MPDWEYCSCPFCGNTLRLRQAEAEVGVLCPVCTKPVRLSEAHAFEDSQAQHISNPDEEEGSGDVGQRQATEEPVFVAPVVEADDPAIDIEEIVAHPVEWEVQASATEPDENAPSPAIQDPPTGYFASRLPRLSGYAKEYRETVRQLVEKHAPAEEDYQPPFFDYSRVNKIDWKDEPDEFVEYLDGDIRDAPAKAGKDGEVGEEDAANQGGAGDKKTNKLRKRRFAQPSDIPKWDTAEPRVKLRDATVRRILRVSLIVLAIVGGILIGLIFMSSRRLAQIDPNAAKVRKTLQLVDGKVLASTDDPQKAVQEVMVLQPDDMIKTLIPIVEKFLQAGTWRDRLPMVRDSARVGPLMERYYARHPDEAYGYINVGRDGALVYRNNLMVLNVLMKDYSIKQVAIEYIKDQFLIDWESFVGFCALEPSELRNQRPVDPTVIRVGISLLVPGYFNYAFTDEANLDCYVVIFPDDSYAFGYVEKTSKVANDLRVMLEMQESQLAVVSVNFPEGSVVGDQFWIHELISNGWVTGGQTKEP